MNKKRFLVVFVNLVDWTFIYSIVSKFNYILKDGEVHNICEEKKTYHLEKKDGNHQVYIPDRD